MTVQALYDFLDARIPVSLREVWDNDGAMCVPDPDRVVHRAIVALDVTEEVVDYAIENSCDLIVSHHPLIFHPLRSLCGEDPVARKLIKLIGAQVSVFSFHTRADRVKGGVNDLLAESLDLSGVVPFGEGGLGRIGELDEQMPLDEFAYVLKEQLAAPRVFLADGYTPVRRVAVVGGDGKDFIADAIAAGADTFVSGHLGYNRMEEAAERGINFVEAGHYYTEQRVTEFFDSLIREAAPEIVVETIDSNLIRLF